MLTMEYLTNRRRAGEGGGGVNVITQINLTIITLNTSDAFVPSKLT